MISKVPIHDLFVVAQIHPENGSHMRPMNPTYHVRCPSVREKYLESCQSPIVVKHQMVH